MGFHNFVRIQKADQSLQCIVNTYLAERLEAIDMRGDNLFTDTAFLEKATTHAWDRMS